MLKEDPTAWLLEPENQSARYFALLDLCGLAEDAPELIKAREAVMLTGLVPEILSKQRDTAYEKGFVRFYHAKYWGLVWQLITLAELGASSNDQIREQCEYLLNNAQRREDGGFSVASVVKGGGNSNTLPCLTGNMIRVLYHFGYEEDPRLEQAVTWLLDHIFLFDGEGAGLAHPIAKSKESCWGRHTCFHGAIKYLKGLAAIPQQNRNQRIKEGISALSEFFLLHHVFKRSHDLSIVSKPGWTKFGYPLMYQTDALEILDILTSLDIKDPRMQEAVDLVRTKQGNDGRWTAQGTANNSKLLCPLSQKQQDKLVTLRALRVLKRWGQA